MKEYLIKRPMLLCGITCIIIAAIGYYSKPVLLIFGIFLAVLLGIMILKKAKAQLIISVAVTFIMLLSTVIACGKTERCYKADNISCNAELLITEIKNTGNSYNSAEMTVLYSSEIKKNTKLIVFYEPLNLDEGQCITADLNIKSLGDNSYKTSYYSKGIFLKANAKNIERIKRKDDFVLTGIGRVRSYIRNTLFSNLSYESFSTLCALVFGDKSYFTNEFNENVKAAGVAHIMVVSGMHLAVLVLLFTFVCDKIIYNRFVKALIIIAVVLLLSLLCGFTMSIMRAGITYIIMALALVINRKNNSSNTLGAAVAVILILSPFAIFSVSLQLSLLSTFGILSVALPIIQYTAQNNLIKSKFCTAAFSAAVITLSATILTLPVSIYVFGYVSAVGIITNLLISYAVTVLLCLAVCALIINLVSPLLAHILFVPCELIAKYINSVIKYFGNLKFAVLPLPKESAFLSVILIIIIFWILLACKKRIDMIKLNEVREKISAEGGKSLKWR